MQKVSCVWTYLNLKKDLIVYTYEYANKKYASHICDVSGRPTNKCKTRITLGDRAMYVSKLVSSTKHTRSLEASVQETLKEIRRITDVVDTLTQIKREVRDK